MKRADQGKAKKWFRKRCLPAALILLAAMVFFTGLAAAAPDADAQYADFLKRIRSAAQDPSRWVHTDDPAAPVRPGAVDRPADAVIAELGSNGFIALADGVTLIRETGGAGGIVAQASAVEGQFVYSLSSYETSPGTDPSVGSRVLIAEQDTEGNWLLNTGKVESLTGGTLTLNAPLQGDEARYIRCFSLHSGNGNSTISIPLNVDISIPGTMGTVFSTGKVKIQGRIELTGDASGDWSFWNWYFWVDLGLQFRLVADYFYIDLATENLGFSQAIVPIQIPIVPGILGVDLSPKLTIKGNAKGEVSFGLNCMFGFDLRVSYNYDQKDKFYSKLNWLSDGPTFTDTSFAIQARLFAGLAWGGNLSLLSGLLSIGINYQDGVLLTADLRGGGYDPSDPERKIWHACEDMKCISGDVRWQKGPISLGISGFWGIVSKTLYNFTDPIISDPFFEFYHSFTFKDGANTACPHVGYRINVHVTDTLKRAVEGAEIAVTPRESRFDAVSSRKKTDASGTAVVYAQRANPTKDTKKDSQLDVTVTASYTDPADPEKKPITVSATATEKGLSADHKLQPQDVYLEMDLRKFCLSFEDIGSGHAQDMPDPLLFFPGRTVHIPDTVPSKSGLQFTGWNTRADGTGSSYAPGSSLTPDGDLTLFAQWRTIWNVWFVLFNANGGTYAPDAQVGVNGESLELTAEPAAWQDHKFLGWAYEEDAMVPDFPAGYRNIVPYDPARQAVTLYALWGFDPVSMPIHITYDMNGGPESQKPKDQWIKSESYMQVSSTAPTWEGHSFLGWSVEQFAGEGEIQPGQYHYFENDTVLYAIWGYSPVLRPITVTYSMNGGPESQKPKDQWIKSGSYMQVSSTVPTWEGHSFLGWSVEQFAGEGEIQPGQYHSFEKDTVLYAIWGYSPVLRPITVTYSMNGGPESGKPAPQTEKAGAWFHLDRKVPQWDEQHLFQGWTKDPKGDKAQYAAGEAVRFDADTTLYAVWERGYRIIEGNGSRWMKDSTEGLRIVADGSFAYFAGVWIDGSQLAADRYNASSGSTVILLKAGYLQTLQEGAHDIRIAYQDGTAEGQFFVVPKPPVPKTGDRGRPALWIGLILLGLAWVVAGVGVAFRKRN